MSSTGASQEFKLIQYPIPIALALNPSQECAFLGKDESLTLGKFEIGEAVLVHPELRPVGLISCQTAARNERPGDIIRAFVGHEIAKQISATARDDCAPGTGILLKRVPLEGVNHITDMNRNGHWELAFIKALASA